MFESVASAPGTQYVKPLRYVPYSPLAQAPVRDRVVGEDLRVIRRADRAGGAHDERRDRQRDRDRKQAEPASAPGTLSVVAVRSHAYSTPVTTKDWPQFRSPFG